MATNFVHEMIRSPQGKMVMSIVWGLGLAALFAKTCAEPGCIVIDGPDPNEVEQNPWRDNEQGCWRFRRRRVSCNAEEHYDGASDTMDKAATALEKSKKSLVLDVRTAQEHATKRLCGAVLVPTPIPPLNPDQMDTLAFRLSQVIRQAELSQDDPIVLYCDRGVRAGAAARILRSAGFTNVHMVGGVSEGALASFLNDPRSRAKQHHLFRVCRTQNHRAVAYKQ